jgi:hypothetical protein
MRLNLASANRSPQAPLQVWNHCKASRPALVVAGEFDVLRMHESEGSGMKARSAIDLAKLPQAEPFKRYGIPPEAADA